MRCDRAISQVLFPASSASFLSEETNLLPPVDFRSGGGYLSSQMSMPMSHDEQNSNIIEDLDAKSQEADGGQTEEVGSVAELQQALITKTDECKALTDKYLRQAADFENYKRLTQREQRDQIRFGNEQIVKELLPVIDNLERAIRSARENGGNEALVQGIDLTLKQALEVLAKFGVRPVVSVGQPFDPSCHQAVAQVASPIVPEHTVVEEFQKGYLLHDRILRAAMVSVSIGPTNS
ncbi:MAG: nucleotide exchange factor GrpE [Nitrospiraceae bacterium]